MVQDPVIRQLRKEVSYIDRALVGAINARLRLVEKIARRKRDLDVTFIDAAREEWILVDLRRANSGPLSEAGLIEFVSNVLELTKRELRTITHVP
jgi:chorismate mutase